MCADAPDTSGLNKAAEMNAEVAREALAWYKQQYADTAPERARASELAMEQATLQNQLSRDQLQASASERDRYNTTFKPIEQRIAQDAMNYDTPARREAAARAAVADTEIALANQQQGSRQAMERRGVMPGSGKALAMQGEFDLGAAKLKAGAANTARERVETVGAAKLMDAAGLGRGVIGNQGTAAGIALNAGNSAVNNGQVPVNVAGQGAQMMGQGFQTAIQGNNSAGSLYGQAANIQASSSDSGLWGALGQVGGAAITKWSDENMKEDVQPVKGDIALSAVRKMPVKGWRYKEDSPAADGGEPHVGPMAQDVNVALGDRVAPEGKMVDMVSLTGTTLAAVQELDRKVTRLEKRSRAA